MRAGVGQYKCATTFVGPNNMAASFNRSSWRAKGEVVSTDMRAFNNHGGDIGLTGFGPNINVVSRHDIAGIWVAFFQERQR